MPGLYSLYFGRNDLRFCWTCRKRSVAKERKRTTAHLRKARTKRYFAIFSIILCSHKCYNAGWDSSCCSKFTNNRYLVGQSGNMLVCSYCTILDKRFALTATCWCRRRFQTLHPNHLYTWLVDLTFLHTLFQFFPWMMKKSHPKVSQIDIHSIISVGVQLLKDWCLHDLMCFIWDIL
jgi:hypothetical protein